MTEAGLVTTLLDRTVIPGLIGFTRFGYHLRPRCQNGGPERMDGRRVVITGATSGLGLEASRQLSALGAELVLVGRNQAKLAAAADDIAATQGCAPVQTELADLESMRDVHALAKRLCSVRRPIHVLINNAGALFATRSATDDGNERCLAINLLAPYLLTQRLIPALRRSAPSRIINVSSGGMYTQPLRIDDLQSARGRYDGARAYARAKRALVALTQSWAEELSGDGVVVHAMHPGWADTPGVRSSLPGFYRLTRPLLRDPAQGADTITWLAAAGRPERSTGGFWLDRRAHPTDVFPGTGVSPADRDALRGALDRLLEPWLSPDRKRA